jgi:hypothetical protein
MASASGELGKSAPLAEAFTHFDTSMSKIRIFVFSDQEENETRRTTVTLRSQFCGQARGCSGTRTTTNSELRRTRLEHVVGSLPVKRATSLEARFDDCTCRTFVPATRALLDLGQIACELATSLLVIRTA